jgi:sugar phosphate permease
MKMAQTVKPTGGQVQPLGAVRWWIAGVLGLGILINYFDRVNLSIAGLPLAHEFHLTPATLGIVFSAYLWSYSLLQIPVGMWLDRIGVTWVTRVATILWSAATFLTAIAGGLGLVLLARVLLGVAEAPAFPACQKATGYWFPRKERGLCTSTFDGAAKFSNVIGIPVVAFIVTQFGWQGAFWFTGILSALYAVVFWVFYRNPRVMYSKGRLSESEYRYITEGGAQNEDFVPQHQFSNLGYLLRNRKVWGLTLGFSAYGYSFYLLLTWLPGYLETQLHMTVLKSGFYTAVPWAVATFTDLVIGGWLVDYLIARGYEPNTVRKTLLVIGMLLGLCVIGAAFTNTANIAIIWISLGLGGLAFAAPIGSSIVALIAPEGSVGTVGGIVNFVNNLLGIAAPIVTGFIVSATGSFAFGFVVAAAVLVVGILCYIFLLGRIEQIPSPHATEESPVGRHVQDKVGMKEDKELIGE